MPPVPRDLRSRVARAHGYETAREDVQALVPLTARNILELGCSTGALGAALRARQPAHVTGVELSQEYAWEAEQWLDRVIVADADAFSAGHPPPEAPFDCLIAADVLEHLEDPWSVLERCRRMLAPGAAVVISLPNVLYGMPRVARERRWPREDQGIFDRTHLRWFTLRDAVELVELTGLHVEHVTPRFWTSGWRRQASLALWRSPLRDFVAAQYVLSARALA